MMQKYFIVFLKSGPERSQTEAEAMKLQEQHLAYLGGLYEKGIINLNGPTDGTGDIRGFSVYNVANIEKARELDVLLGYFYLVKPFILVTLLRCVMPIRGSASTRGSAAEWRNQ